MLVSVWVAVAVLVSPMGEAQIIHSDEGYPTKAACEALQKEALPRIRAHPAVDAFGQVCVEVKVAKK